MTNAWGRNVLYQVHVLSDIFVLSDIGSGAGAILHVTLHDATNSMPCSQHHSRINKSSLRLVAR